MGLVGLGVGRIKSDHQPIVNEASWGVKDKSPAATSRVWVDPVLPVCKLEIYLDGNHGPDQDHIIIIW